MHGCSFFIIHESDKKESLSNQIGFNDFIKKYQVEYLSENFQHFLIRDILGIKKPELLEMGYYEYNEALQYSLITHKSRNVHYQDETKAGQGKPFTHAQKKNHDHDPNFYSKVGKMPKKRKR